MYRTTEFLHVKHVEMAWNEVEALLTQGLEPPHLDSKYGSYVGLGPEIFGV
jgi:hypothetical protein